MKKIIIFVLIISSVLSFLILFNNENNRQYSSMQNAEYVHNTYRVLIPSEVANEAQEEVYKGISKVADKYNANIYFNRLGNDNQSTIVYAYLTNYNYFKNFKLTKGRFFKLSENNSTKFLSTKNTGKKEQIGRISDFAGYNTFEIHTLKGMIKNNEVFNGYFIVQIDKNVQGFLKDLSKEFKADITDARPVTIFNYNPYDIYILAICFYFVAGILILYDILKSYKKIGTMKMLGYSTFKIWVNKLSSIISLQFIIFIVTCFICSIFKFKEYNQFFLLFLIKLFKINVILIFVSSIIYSIPFIYVKKITVSAMLKNKQPLKIIAIFNIIIKICTMAAFVIFINVFIINFNRIKSQFTHSYSQWEQTKYYAVISTFKTIDVNYTTSEEYNAKEKQIYEYFNKRGAILADFGNFEPGQRKLNLAISTAPWYTDTVTVNANYLKSNPIYNTAGKRVYLSENQKAYILMVPDKYLPYEAQIRQLVDKWKKGYPQGDRVYKEQTKIVWIKSGQQLFSYNINVNSNNNNFVKNPFIRVVTEANASNYDYKNVAICSGNPFKIKVSDPKNPNKTILPELSKLKLNIYDPAISSVYDVVGSEIQKINVLEKTLFTEIIIVSTLIILIVFQNIYNFFDINKQKLVIQQFLGYKKLDRYIEYFFLIFFSWVIIFNVVLLIQKINFQEIANYTSDIQMQRIIIISILAAVSEAILSFIALGFVEKQKIVNVLKGS